MDPRELAELLRTMAQGSNAAAMAAERLAATLTDTDNALTGTNKTASAAASGLSSITGKINPLAMGINALAQAVAGYISVQMRLTKSVIDFQTTVYDTENVFANMTEGVGRSFEHLKNLVDTVGGPIKDFVGELTGLKSFFDAVGKVVKAAMDIVEAQNKQNMKVLGQSFSAMQNLTGSFGALTLDLTEFSNTARAAGLTSDQFSRMLVNNSKSLSATFGGSSAAATVLKKEFTALKDDANNVRSSFVAMGLNNDDMAEAMAEYANNQRLLGIKQQYDQGQLASKTLEYQKNLAAISAITGKNAKEQQEERKARLMQGQFAAKIEQMVLDGKKAEAMALQEAVAVAAEYGPAFEKLAIEQAVLGQARTTEAAKTMMMNRALAETTQAAIDAAQNFAGQEDDTQGAQKQARELFAARSDEIKAQRNSTIGLVKLAAVTDNAFIQGLSSVFVETRDTIAKTQTMAVEFNTALEKLGEGIQGLTSRIAEEDRAQQNMRVSTEAGVLANGTSVLDVARAFTQIASLEANSSQRMTQFSNKLSEIARIFVIRYVRQHT